jgi:DNA uptake protein ComE-like DNA-binding protein
VRGAGRVHRSPVPTDSERKALWFLALVALSGGAVRLWRATHRAEDVVAVAALDQQLERVDSARARSVRRERRVPAARVVHDTAAAAPSGPVDLDRADSAAIETLPGIGPALAARIVANRDSAGSFGAVEVLCDVRGVGPALVKRLRPLVTFSGPRRPVSDECGGASKRARNAAPARRRKPS